MTQWTDSSPAIRVDPERYRRLLGYPARHVLAGRALDLAEWAREWYSQHGRPWIFARQPGHVTIDIDRLEIEGISFRSDRMLQSFARAGVNGVVLAAVCAGAEVEEEAQKRWREEKPDEYFFLEVYGSAVVEHLIEVAAGRLGTVLEPGTMLLPHHSPGYAGWDITEQPNLLRLMAGSLPSRLEALESGALRPKKSQLAVFGLAARREDSERRIAASVPCHFCSTTRCDYRRTATDHHEQRK